MVKDCNTIDYIAELIKVVCDMIHVVQDSEGTIIYPVKSMIF